MAAVQGGGPSAISSGQIVSQLSHADSGPGATASNEPPAGGILGKEGLEVGGSGLGSLFPIQSAFSKEFQGALSSNIAESLANATGKAHGHIFGNIGDAGLKDTPLEAGLGGFNINQPSSIFGNVLTAHMGATGKLPGFSQ